MIKHWPFVGSIALRNPAQQYLQWAQELDAPDMFQMRLGNRMVVVVHSYDAIKELWIKQKRGNNSRPILHTFHNMVSSTQGFTVGTTPWGDSYRLKKKLVANSLNRSNVAKRSELIDQENMLFLKQTVFEGDVNLMKSLQKFVLRVALFLTYGHILDIEDSSLFEEITEVENTIGRLRSHTSNLQDYIPILRLLPNQSKELANKYRKRRDTYMINFITALKGKMENNQPYVDCIVSDILTAQKEEGSLITDAEIKSICLTMVSAGLDNTPLVLNHCIGHLSQPTYGKHLQARALESIREAYNGDLEAAFKMCPYEFKADYIMALIKESLRYYSVLPLSLPRETTRDIVYSNCVIPSGTILFMNTFGANHDSRHFASPFTFNPERYLSEGKIITKTQESTHQFGFGAGTRMCAGMYLAEKEMYVALTRLLLLYEIQAPHDLSSLMELDPFKLNAVPDSIAIEPGEYAVQSIPHNPQLHRFVMA